ncbi:complex I subunit 5 family protein [Thermococcus sp. GR6]|uniref:complex I subunit 5 family protein n=1 Tax=Thermococcus sp. GR6 TaxID=1638256 RepID=UPI001430D415|nr:complex I subunit 5 family protein [Thermococcus sp. GR6]NJE41956.1 sodium:proton antiporter [Thermococcus sp. GR6]
MIPFMGASAVAFALVFFMLGAFAPLFRRDFRVSLPFSMFGSAITLITGIYGLWKGVEGEILSGLFMTSIKIDPLSGFFISLLGLIGLFSSMYLLDYKMRPKPLIFAIAYNGTLLSALLFLSTNNLEKMTIAYELMAVFTLALILGTVAKGGRVTARNYIVLTQVFGIIPLLIATSLAYAAVGNIHHLTFEGLNENLEKLPVRVWFLYVLYLFPALVRSGVFPFHTWVPRIYQRIPSSLVPVFIVLEGAGLYLLIRMDFYVLPPTIVLGYAIAALGTISAFATLYSFREIRLKRKFAYHSVMDVGITYFVLGSAVVFRNSLVGAVLLIGALLHTIYQILYKSAIFFSLGAIEHYGEEPNICSIRKLFKGHVMSFLLSISAFSMAGLPPLAAFVSKWLIYEGSLMTGDVYTLLMLSAVMFLGLFPFASIVQIRRLNRELCKREVGAENVPLFLRIVVGAMALLTIGGPLLPLLVQPILIKTANEAVGIELESLSDIFLASVPASLLSLTILIMTAFIGTKLGKMPTERISELLLIFYNVGDILKFTARFFVDAGKKAYLNYLLPIIKVVPKHELPLVKDYDDAMDYPIRHIDEAMFMPLIRAIERASTWGREQSLDMNAMISRFAIVMALLIVLLGVIA